MEKNMENEKRDLLTIGDMVNQSANIPEALRAMPIWLVWRRERVKGRQTKVPYDAKTGRRASSTDPATWATFDVAVRALKSGGYNGLGIGISNDIAAIDIDYCVDHCGNLTEMATDIVEKMDCYTEYSPSGTGLRLIFMAPGFVYDKVRYYINNQKAGLEVYIAGSTNKYVTITGRVLYDRPIEDRSERIGGVLEAYMRRPEMPKPTRVMAAKAQPTQTSTPSQTPSPTFSDADILRKAQAAANGDAFRALWAGQLDGAESHSEADLALCAHLAFWTGGDAARIDSLFRMSGLYRDKWARADYREATITKAISGCAQFYEPRPEDFKPSATAQADPLYQKIRNLCPEANPHYRWTDIGSGQLFADVYKDAARFVPERKKWFTYDGVRWAADVEGLHVMTMCKHLADSLTLYALSIREEITRKNYMEYIAKWQARAFRERILKDAASVHYVPIARFDRHPYLFNCLNGTLDLKTNVFRQHDPEDMLCKVAGVHYDQEAECERWERFIQEIMLGDDAKALFLQKALGYALTGDTSRECFFILYGPTSRNGKGTCMETFLRLLGDYGMSAKPDTIAQKQTPNGSGPSEDVARLQGARFVNISEPDKKLILSAAQVKTLTGNDSITARFLHENSFEYRPEFKLFINTNYLPQTTDVTLFSSGRVKVIPFERHFGEHERDPDLKAELIRPENLSGILNWCIEGLKWIEELGFDAPASVLAATQAYQMDSDKFSRFLAEEFEEDYSASTQLMAAYVRFKIWCDGNGYQAENMKNFRAGLRITAEVRKVRLDGMTRNDSPVSALMGYRLRPRDDHKNGGFYY